MVAIREQLPLARKTMTTIAEPVSCIASEEGELKEALRLRQVYNCLRTSLVDVIT